MSGPQKPVNQTAETLDEDDPLAQLARIVSTGSVFSDPIQTPDTPEALTEKLPTEQADVDPTAEEASEFSVQPVVTESAVRIEENVDDLDLLLGEQLEAELHSELAGAELLSEPVTENAEPAIPEEPAYLHVELPENTLETSPFADVPYPEPAPETTVEIPVFDTAEPIDAPFEEISTETVSVEPENPPFVEQVAEIESEIFTSEPVETAAEPEQETAFDDSLTPFDSSEQEFADSEPETVISVAQESTEQISGFFDTVKASGKVSEVTEPTDEPQPTETNTFDNTDSEFETLTPADDHDETSFADSLIEDALADAFSTAPAEPVADKTAVNIDEGTASDVTEEFVPNFEDELIASIEEEFAASTPPAQQEITIPLDEISSEPVEEAPAEPEVAPVTQPDIAETDLDPISSFIQAEIAKAQQDLNADVEPQTEPIPAKPEIPSNNVYAPYTSGPSTEDLLAELAAPLETVKPAKEFATPPEVTSTPETSTVDSEAKPEIDLGQFEADLFDFDDELDGEDDGTFETILDTPDTVATTGENVIQTDAPSMDADAPDALDPDAGPPEIEQENSGKASILLAAAAALSIVVIGAGAFVFFDGGPDVIEPVVIAADPTPIRQKPDDPGGKVIPNTDNPVFKSIEEEGVQEEEPAVDIVENNEQPLLFETPEPAEQPRVVLPAGPQTAEDQIRATIPDPGPRQVRTVVVRPDGTPVTGEVEPVPTPQEQEENPGADNAPIEITPNATITDILQAESADRANREQQIATVEESETSSEISSPLLLRETLPPIDTTSNEVEAEPVVEDTPPAEPVVIAATPSELAPEPVTEALAPPVDAVQAPAPRPNTFRGELAQQRAARAREQLISSPPTVPAQSDTPVELQPVAPATPAPAPSAEENTSIETAQVFSPAPIGGGATMVQLASRRTEAQAQTSFATLRRRHSYLGGYSADIARADLGDRGVYHRLRVGPFSRPEAVRLCEQLKADGTDCILARN